jgi:hypothetical protein
VLVAKEVPAPVTLSELETVKFVPSLLTVTDSPAVLKSMVSVPLANVVAASIARDSSDSSITPALVRFLLRICETCPLAFEIKFFQEFLRSMTHPKKTVWKQSKRYKLSTTKVAMLLGRATFRKRKDRLEPTYPPIPISCRSKISTERLMQRVKKYLTLIGLGERSIVSDP